MNERIKELRNSLKLTQNDFGVKIGVARNTIANYETGNRIPSNQIIISICREFNVNEKWLRTGEGEMIVRPDDEFGAALGEIIDTDDEFIRNMFIGIANMSPSDRDVLKKAIEIIKKSNIF